jgi:hypothetical protein
MTSALSVAINELNREIDDWRKLAWLFYTRRIVRPPNGKWGPPATYGERLTMQHAYPNLVKYMEELEDYGNRPPS